jgi:hypothetical protein
LQAAERACQTLLPAGGSTQQQEQQCFQAGDCPQVLVQQLLTVERKFAQCMRSHGVPNWPDPAIDAQGRPVFPVAEAGMSRATAHSPQMTAKIEECQREAPSPVVFG